MLMQTSNIVNEFQFTRPAWGATAGLLPDARGEHVSIHAPRVGRDFKLLATGFVIRVSIHAPRVGRDVTALSDVPSESCFNSRAPRGARHVLLSWP